MTNDKLIAKLNEIKFLADECLAALTDSSTKHKKSLVKKSEELNKDSKDYILSIVNKIKNCEEADKIDKKILSEVSVPGRVLLPFYICYKYFSQLGLTTGDVAKIRSELQIGTTTSNVSHAITNSLHKYLEGDSTRVKGKAVFYKLTENGAKYFVSLLNADEEK